MAIDRTQHGIVTMERIESRISLIRGQRIMLDMDLAELYGVPTKRLNEQVKRNPERFPEDFMFQLTPEEKAEVVANCDHLSRIRFSHVLPYAFTEHGAIMAANVLNSPLAVQASVYVVRAFVRMRREFLTHLNMEKRLAQIEKTLLGHDVALRDLYQKIRPLLLPPPSPSRARIGFQRKAP